MLPLPGKLHDDNCERCCWRMLPSSDKVVTTADRVVFLFFNVSTLAAVPASMSFLSSQSSAVLLILVSLDSPTSLLLPIHGS